MCHDLSLGKLSQWVLLNVVDSSQVKTNVTVVRVECPLNRNHLAFSLTDGASITVM